MEEKAITLDKEVIHLPIYLLCKMEEKLSQEIEILGGKPQKCWMRKTVKQMQTQWKHHHPY